jgi:hypothetical protein
MTVLLISKISSTCFGQILPIFRSARLRFFTVYGIVSFCCGRKGFGARQLGTTCTVWRKLPTTTAEHYTIRCTKSQSYAPEDGQKFARNMLSWSWRSINFYCCISLVFYITLPTCIIFDTNLLNDIFTD